jgi:putative pyruvate formate lyase activating enzyme
MKTAGPSYLRLARSGELARRAREGAAHLRRCDLCPRRCGVDRAAGETGECDVGALAAVASYGPHHGEERVLSGWAGSGTVFFGGCNLHCRFCQNWDISHEVAGAAVDATGLADIFLRVQELGCHNLNLVTPSHDVPQILGALDDAAGRGLALPVVYNTSAYDALETLALLDGVVDIYMPDLKTLDERFAREALTAADYPETATAAIAEMHRQVGDLVADADGLATRGLLVRHLVMPGMASDGAEVLAWLAGLSRDTFANVTGQYRPCGDAARGACGPDLRRRPTPAELESALAAARALGLRRAGRH